MLKSLIVALVCLSASAYADNWALLIAGSNGYDNYRHQADVCHAYQVLHRNGIPDERIVVMMYNDIANNDENPTKGVIVNFPNGTDVYKGVLTDYTGDDVTPANFLSVLKGDAAKMKGIGSGKVIASGPDDNVFVFFSDHGAPGLVAFPNGDVLHASDLNDALISMNKGKQYKQMVMYIEACESGSMFEGVLHNNISVYVTTAANPDESSYACYFDDLRGTYLGDLYSVSWMEDSDKSDVWSETLDTQFKTVRQLTTESHVMEYGDLTISAEFLGAYQGKKSSGANGVLNYQTASKADAVRTEDVKLSVLAKKLSKEVDQSKVTKLHKKIAAEHKLKRVAAGVIREVASVTLAGKPHNAIKEVINKRTTLTNHVCYKQAVNKLIANCFTMKNDYALRHLYVFVNLCEQGVPATQIMKAIEHVCVHRYE